MRPIPTGKPKRATLEQMDKRLDAELKKIHDDFQPPKYYIEQFGYQIARHGSISYEPAAKAQTPLPKSKR